MATVFQRAVKFLSEVNGSLVKAIYFRYPPEGFLPAVVNLPSLHEGNNYRRKSLSEILKESFIWAVPKKRRTREKRACRRFGVPKYFYKPFLPKTNILICSECGSYKEAGLLCPNCYSKVKEATTEMQDAIEKAMGIAPVENEVVVLYSDDERRSSEFHEGKRIVEIKKDRPKIFSDNLLQKSTEGQATTKDVVTKNVIS